MEVCKIPRHSLKKNKNPTAWNYRAFACSCESLWHVDLIFQYISNLHLFKCVQRGEGWHCIIHQNVPFEEKGRYYLNHQKAALLVVKRQIFDERLLKVSTCREWKLKSLLIWNHPSDEVKSCLSTWPCLCLCQQNTANNVFDASCSCFDKGGHYKE